nr:collagen alpha-1(I) chain [Oryctolagus cuniculus]
MAGPRLGWLSSRKRPQEGRPRLSLGLGPSGAVWGGSRGGDVQGPQRPLTSASGHQAPVPLSFGTTHVSPGPQGPRLPQVSPGPRGQAPPGQPRATGPTAPPGQPRARGQAPPGQPRATGPTAPPGQPRATGPTAPPGQPRATGPGSPRSAQGHGAHGSPRSAQGHGARLPQVSPGPRGPRLPQVSPGPRGQAPPGQPRATGPTAPPGQPRATGPGFPRSAQGHRARLAQAAPRLPLGSPRSVRSPQPRVGIQEPRALQALHSLQTPSESAQPRAALRVATLSHPHLGALNTSPALPLCTARAGHTGGLGSLELPSGHSPRRPRPLGHARPAQGPGATLGTACNDGLVCGVGASQACPAPGVVLSRRPRAGWLCASSRPLVLIWEQGLCVRPGERDLTSAARELGSQLDADAGSPPSLRPAQSTSTRPFPGWSPRGALRSAVTQAPPRGHQGAAPPSQSQVSRWARRRIF